MCIRDRCKQREILSSGSVPFVRFAFIRDTLQFHTTIKVVTREHFTQSKEYLSIKLWVIYLSKSTIIPNVMEIIKPELTYMNNILNCFSNLRN